MPYKNLTRFKHDFEFWGILKQTFWRDEILDDIINFVEP